MEPETWRPVAGYGGAYEVSDLGSVRSWKTPGKARRRAASPRVLRACVGHQAGYLQVTLSDGPSARTIRVHVLIARVFIGPRPDGMQVAHRDGDPTNNRLANLRYAPPVDNNRDKIAHARSLRGAHHNLARLTEAQARSIKQRAAAGERHQALADEFGVSRWHVGKIARGQKWAHLKDAS